MNAKKSPISLAKCAYASKDFDRAKILLDRIVSETPGTMEEKAARYLRARGYEDGNFTCGTNLDEAYEDYVSLSESKGILGSLAMTGCARVLYSKGARENVREILDRCHEAQSLHSNPKAMMLLGLVHEEIIHDSASAKKWYLMAYKAGLPWGLRYYAGVQLKEKKYIRAFLAHVLVFVTSPILVLIYGIRSPFK